MRATTGSSARYVGGYEGPGQAFTFSFYGEGGGGELWIQFTLEEAHAIATGRLRAVSARPAET